MIRLQGKWLEELGFLVGRKIVVKETQEGLLIKAKPVVEPEPEPAKGKGRKERRKIR